MIGLLSLQNLDWQLLLSKLSRWSRRKCAGCHIRLVQTTCTCNQWRHGGHFAMMPYRDRRLNSTPRIMDRKFGLKWARASEAQQQLRPPEGTRIRNRFRSHGLFLVVEIELNGHPMQTTKENQTRKSVEWDLPSPVRQNWWSAASGVNQYQRSQTYAGHGA